MAFLYFLLLTRVFAPNERQIINEQFSFDIAQDMTYLAYQVYYSEEVGGRHGRDKTWAVQTPTYCSLGEHRSWQEGHVYEYVGDAVDKPAYGELPICTLGVRGTENIEDFYQDALITATEVTDLTTGEVFFAHRGALELVSCYTFISDYLNEHCNKRALYLVGHSLGGGIVNLLSLGLLHGMSVNFPGTNLDYTINKIEHNIQTYSSAAMKLWTLPYNSAQYEDDYKEAIFQMQNNIPCPSILSNNHAYRMYAVHRTSDSLTVDLPSLSKPLCLFRYCTEGYEVDMKTGTLTHYQDTHAPDFTGPNYKGSVDLHFSINMIYAVNAPIAVYVDQGCTEPDDVNLENQDKYRAPGMEKRVRCCEGRDQCTSRNHKKECAGKLPFWKAVEFCENLDMHVCKADELNRCCGFRDDSCYYNDNDVWTSDVIHGTAETKVIEYPVLDATDPQCRGIHCEVTKHSILIPRSKDALDSVYNIDLSLNDRLQTGGHGGISMSDTEISLGASLRIPKEETNILNINNNNWISRYIFAFILGCTLALICLNSINSKRQKSSLLEFGEMIDEL